MRESPLLRAIETSVQGAGLPYGYAITVWSTGSVLVGEHGTASLPATCLFVAGAIVAYGTLKVLTWKTSKEAEKPLAKSPHPIRAGLIHICAIALAISAALGGAQAPEGAAWALAPFAATFVYLSVSSVEVALVEEDR